MADIGSLNPEQMLEQQRILRQQKMAEMLMQQGAQQPQAQIVGGRYVAPSIFQNLAGLANQYVGQKGIERAENAQLELAKKLREQGVQETQRLMNTFGGRAATPDQVTEMAGPYGMSGAGQNVPMPTATIDGTPAITANPKLAYAEALNMQSPQARALLPFLAAEAFKKPKYKEITQYNSQTGNTETYRYDENSANPRETLQFLGISKPAISPEAQIRFGDDGIPIPPQFRGGATGQPAGQPTAPNAVQTPSQPVAGQPRPAQPVSAPLINDPFKPPPPPPTLSSGKEIREWKAEQAKPLTGTAYDIVNGAKNYQKAVFKIQELFDQYTAEDLAKPNVRAIFGQAVENARLQGKEANKLGALTGPDYGILEKLVVDPVAFNQFLVDRKTINQLYNNERAFTSEIIKGAYETAQKPVPENLRPFVEVKPKELTKTDSNKPKGSVSIQRGVLNGEPIEVRNKKWVYSKTGKAVE
jgi:hypothetical protein